MKKFKSLIVILTIMLVALTAIMPTISFAADEEGTETETYIITVTGDVAGRTLKTLKLFNLEIIKDSDNNEQYVYTWASTAVQTYFSNLSVTDNEGNTLNLSTVEAAVEYLSSLSNTELIEFANSYYESNSTSATTTTVNADATSVDITVDGLGYYLIYDATTEDLGEGRETSVTMLSNVIVSGNTTIELKANVVEVEKTADKTSANVGDTVTFTVTSKVPDTTQYDTYSFVVTDTMSDGLDYVANSVKVKIGKTDATEKTDYTVSYENHVLTITFATTSWDNMTDQDIVITYDATLNSTAATAIENTNKVQITYSNDPTTGSTGTTTTEEVKVYSYTINLTKKNVAGETLKGAEFVLSRTDDNGSTEYLKITTTTDDDGNTTTTYSWVTNMNDATTFTTDSDGKVSITGIEAGKYTLVETVAPEGYNLPTSDLQFTITDDTTNSTTAATLSESSEYLEATTSTVTAGSASALAMTVLNNSSTSLLPSTGGIGTTIFTIVGIAVMAIAVIALVVRNRKSKRA